MKIKNLSILFICLTGLLVPACKETSVESKPDSPPFLSVAHDQVGSLNRILLNEIYVPQNAWATVHMDSGNGSPVLSSSLGWEKYLSAGVHQEESLIVYDSALSYSSPMRVWVMLHEDNGQNREYEYNTSNGKLDQPLKLEDTGELLSEPVLITAPRIDAKDQTLSNNQIVVDSLLAGSGAWVVVHDQSPEDEAFDLSYPEGALRIPKGAHYNLTVQLDSAKQYPSGTPLYVILCKDKTRNGEWYVYDVPPEMYGSDFIFSKIELLP